MTNIVIKIEESPTLCALLIAFAFIYVWQIFKSIIRIYKIITCINVLHAFIYSATPSRYGPINKSKKYERLLKTVLRKYPDIDEFTTIYSTSLSYKDPSDETYRNSILLYQELLMKRNYLIKEFKQSLNPINAVKLVVTLPSTLIELIGFKPKESFAKLLNLVGWILAYFLNLYSAEIKTFISSLLKLQ